VKLRTITVYSKNKDFIKVSETADALSIVTSACGVIFDITELDELIDAIETLRPAKTKTTTSKKEAKS